MQILYPKGEPYFLSGEPQQDPELVAMRELLPRVARGDLNRLRRDIAMHERGMRGEAQIRFELANSHLPLCVIQDLYLEHDGLSAQIDFLVVTPYVTHVIECKHLVGDIEIDGSGAFTRVLSAGQRREGMYSPVTQNERHLNLMRKMLLDDTQRLKRALLEKFFSTNYRSLVVLAEDKSRLDYKDAPKEIRDQVIRKDALIKRIDSVDKEYRRNLEFPRSRTEMEELAQHWIDRGSIRAFDLTGRYRIYDSAMDTTPSQGSPTAQRTQPQVGSPVPHTMQQPSRTKGVPSAAPAQESPLCPRCGAPMVLRTARRGKRAGKQFWGCSTYPKCRGIVTVETVAETS